MTVNPVSLGVRAEKSGSKEKGLTLSVQVLMALRLSLLIIMHTA